FAKILALPQVSYFGHLQVGEGYALHLDALREFNPAALVFSVGAQGTKSLGLPGEHAKGVYSAKDYVFYYNQLPPFSSQDFSSGKRVAIVGMGNVAIDIAHWLLVDDPHHSAEEVTICGRPGPFRAGAPAREGKSRRRGPGHHKIVGNHFPHPRQTRCGCQEARSQILL